MATNFGIAKEYNVFVFDHLSLSNTTVEGRVAVGGNTVVSPPSTVIRDAAESLNGSLIVGAPIDFIEAERYLSCASVFWATLEPNGVGEVVLGQLNLTATDPVFNAFTFESTDIYGTGIALNQLNGINIIAPVESTVLINITGPAIQFGGCQISRNGTTATRQDARHMVWNFPESLTWANGTTAIYGSVLAPFADANTTFHPISGNMIFSSLTGNAEIHNELFEGELPDVGEHLLPSSSASTNTFSITTPTYLP